MSATRPAVEVSDVGVHFRVPQDRILSFKEYVLRRLARRVDHFEFWALRSIDLEVWPGEVFGIVGRNGAGKSTLLKVMSRVLHPTTGRVILRGSVAPLLELGAGFHPDMTGEENIFINSVILGYTRAEVTRRLQQVVEFAELDEFIDAPVRTYSSGMQARLGFAVATMFRPDILLIDELLSVGDIGFQERCMRRMGEFLAAGTAIVLVSHSLETVAQYCARAAWIDGGRIVDLGKSAEVLEKFRASLLPAG